MWNFVAIAVFILALICLIATTIRYLRVRGIAAEGLLNARLRLISELMGACSIIVLSGGLALSGLKREIDWHIFSILGFCLAILGFGLAIAALCIFPAKKK